MESERDRKIRERAYELWVQGGQRSDSSEQDWRQAEQEFAAGSESPAVEAGAPVAKKSTRAKASPAAAQPAAAPAEAPKPARASGKTAAKPEPESAAAKPATKRSSKAATAAS